jgi:DNA-binding CsgD family transcriptional regulator
MIEFIANPRFFTGLLLFVTFYSFASSVIALALFVFNRKYPALINGVILFILSFIALWQYILINEQRIEALMTSQEPEYLSKTNAWLFLVLIFGILVLGTIAIKTNSKGFKVARADIAASEKALIPPNSMWKPEQGLTENTIQKYQITEAEQAAANLALLGKSNKEIASKLHKAVGTIEAQLKSVYQKTGAPGRYALIALVANSKTVENE